MDPSPPRKELRLQGPRPAALKIRDDSHIINKKPPPHKPPRHHHRNKPIDDHDQPHPPRQPVIIYSVSPKVIYADESEFRSLVQRLTGPNTDFASTSSAAGGGGDVSPAARLATVEKTMSPKEWDRGERTELTSAVMAEGGVEMSQIPGILSPAPGNLPPISDGFFSYSSVIESPQWPMMSHDFSPNFRYGGFTPSPSALFSSAAAPSITSPTISYDLFNHFIEHP